MRFLIAFTFADLNCLGGTAMKALVLAESNAAFVELANLLDHLGASVVGEEETSRRTGSHRWDLDFDIVFFSAVEGCERLSHIVKLRERAPEVPMIAVADAGRREAIAAAIRAGCSDYLLAPLSLSSLRGQLEKWCGAIV